jgi:hypothetical protein
VFGYAGDRINGLLAAWGRSADGPRFVQARHEEMAAFEAVGYAKFTGRLGVCTATSGPGAIHLLNGLYDAKLDHVPVLALVGQTNRSAMGGAYQQEVDLLSLFKDVASDYVQMVTVPEQLPGVLDRAVRTALGRRAPTAVVLPADVQELEYSAPTHAFKMVPSSLGVAWPELAPLLRRPSRRARRAARPAGLCRGVRQCPDTRRRTRSSPGVHHDRAWSPRPEPAGPARLPRGYDILGNHVNAQFRLDVFGEALLLFAAAGRLDRLDARHRSAVTATVAAIEQRWSEPDAGIWELDNRRWAHSRLICAAGLRAVAGYAGGQHTAAWSTLADAILADTADCVHPSGRWQRAPDDPRVDAALLLPAVRGAVPAADARSVATYRAVG